MRTYPTVIVVATLSILVVAKTTAALADDAFFDIPISDLKITSGELPKTKNDEEGYRYDPRREAMIPKIVLEGDGEAYLHSPNNRFWPGRYGDDSEMLTAHVLIRAPKDKDVSGLLTLPKHGGAGMALIKFALPASKANDSAKENLYSSKADYYAYMAQQPMLGTAWFRHQYSEAIDQYNRLARHDERTKAMVNLIPSQARDLSDTYDLFSGGQAIAESLQLDRMLRERPQIEKPDIDISTLEGITVAAIDWKALLKDANQQLDPLSKLIPADQHVIFFPSFAASTKLSDEANGGALRLMSIAEPRCEDADIVGRYERQLGLGLTTLGRILGPAVIHSMALTGSDPYFPTGTDVAVLFETDQPATLAAMLQAQIQLKAAKNPDVRTQQDKVGGLAYNGFRSADRKVSSYVAQLNGAVVVTNSIAQLERLAKVNHGIDPISSLDEYKFFRTRYPLGDKSETALLFISDPTIRRWCSPRWRIASARRTHTASEISELTASNVQSLATGNVKPGALHTDAALIDAGELSISNSGVASSTQGTLEFLTPIIELPIEKVTKSEADAYKQWRDSYQLNWRWAFDPIALRIGVDPGKLAADLTIMPLIAGSDYHELIAISRGAEIKPTAGDPHQALAQATLAINTKSERMRQLGSMASGFAPQARIEPFGWLGSSVSLYLDDDPFWKEISEVPPEKRDEFMRHAWGKLPIGLHAEVGSSLKLTAFLAAVRAFIEQTAPGMTIWESLTYRDEPYVRIKPTERATKEIGEDANVAIYYAPSADGLTVTLNEAVIKRAIDRRLDRRDAKNVSGNSSDAKAPAAPMPWLGSNLCLQVDRKMFEILSQPRLRFFEGPDSFTEAQMQIRSWSNLPILNEWKRLFPNEDPVKVHERLWHTTLVCPGGGQYVWNDQWKTMESTVYGHPGEPKAGPKVTELLGRFQSANFGLTFEEHGLRARIELARDAEPSKAAK
jgi:hypothetical protein